jgi:hypothetical protein
MKRSVHFAVATSFYAVALTASAGDFGALPGLSPLPSLAAPVPAAAPHPAPTVYVPVAAPRNGRGVTYYDDGSPVYGSDGSTATRYGDLLARRPRPGG